MKKLLPLLLTFALLLLTACGGQGGEPTTTAAPAESTATTAAVTTAPAAGTYPADLLGTNLAFCREIYSASGEGLLCADGGFLYTFSSPNSSVYYATHEKVVNQRDDSSDVIKTLYCTVDGIELLPGLVTGRMLETYQALPYAIGACNYDSSLWSYCAASQTVFGGQTLYVQVFFYQPDLPSSGIVISTQRLSGALPAVSAQERENYPLAYIGRPTAELLETFSNVSLLSDFDTAQDRWPFLRDAGGDAELPPDDASYVRGLEIVSEQIEILPGMKGSVETLNITLQPYEQEYWDENGAVAGSFCCMRIGALNLEWYFSGDDGAWISILSKTYI